MPQEFLTFPPVYTVVGAYRLAHDPNLWRPMWLSVRPSLRRAAIAAMAWAVCTWPIQRLIVDVFMKGSARVTGMRGLYSLFIGFAEEAEDHHNIIPLPSLTTFAAFLFVLGQCQTIIEFVLRRKLRQYRAQAYSATVSSRGYSTQWWMPYVEEWQEPPYQDAQVLFAKKPLTQRLSNKVIQRVVVRFVLLPLDFIPFLSIAVSAYFRAFIYAQQLLTPFFAQKRMTPQQVHLFLTERMGSIKSYGFACALLERIPIIGIVFSISNRVGAAMLAHDLEKRQHKFAAGELRRLPKDQTETLNIKSLASILKSSDGDDFAPQAEDGFDMPGAVLSSEKTGGTGGFPSVASAAPAEGLKHRPVPAVPAAAPAPGPNEPPPAYTEHDMAEAIGMDS